MVARVPAGPRRRRTLVAGVALAAVTALAGCGLPTAGGFVPTGQLAGPISDVEGLEDAQVAVGSKNFSENILLGKMAVILLQSAGADVTDLTNIPGSAAARQAMVDGQIQAMWEYTGTGWITYLGEQEPIPDEQEQYEAVRDRDLEENDLVWLPPAPMNNTYGFAVTAEGDERLGGIDRLSQLADVPVEERTLCVESELLNRPDGLPGMLETYDVPLGEPDGVPRDNLLVLQTGAIYDATAGGDCVFGEVFTTDGRILALDLKVLEDDRQFFPKYNVSLVLTEDVYEEHPEIEELMAPVTEQLTDELLIELNARIDVEGQEPADVAYDWLLEAGFITEE